MLSVTTENNLDSNLSNKIELKSKFAYNGDTA